MRLTQYTDLTLRMLIYLAARTDRLSTVRAMATSLRVSQTHLAKISQALAATGILVSSRGRSGGVRLAVPAETISVGDIVRQTESDFRQAPCYDDPSVCPLFPGCRLRRALDEALASYLAALDRYRLSDLVGPGTPIRQALGI